MGKIEWAMWANEQAVASSVGKKSNWAYNGFNIGGPL